MARETKSTDLIAQYKRQRPLYKAFTGEICQLLTTLMKLQDIDFSAIDPRTKDVESFEGKISREDKDGKYNNVEDVTDLSGIRIIAYLEDDCAKICKMIESNFCVDTENSIRKDQEIEEDRFGYLSIHYVISLKKDRQELPEFSRFKGLKAEIQVRTLLQHTWAAIDWKFRYKSDREAPRDLRRRLFRISALLEAADNEFSAVNNELQALRQSYAKNISRGNLDIKLDSESLKIFISTNKTVKDLIDIAASSGIRVIPPSVASYKFLMTTLSAVEISDLGELNNKLEKFLPKARNFFENLSNEMHIRKERDPSLVPAAIIRYLLYYLANEQQRVQINQKAHLADGWAEGIAAVTRV